MSLTEIAEPSHPADLRELYLDRLPSYPAEEKQALVSPVFLTWRMATRADRVTGRAETSFELQLRKSSVGFYL